MQDSGLPQQFSPKRTVTIPQIERRVNQSSLNRDAKEPSCDNREEQYGISNESPQFPEAAIASGAVIAAGGALAGCSPNGGSTGGSGEAEQVVGTAPVSFSEETDVLILGTGIAGMSQPWIRSKPAIK